MFYLYQNEVASVCFIYSSNIIACIQTESAMPVSIIVPINSPGALMFQFPCIAQAVLYGK